MVDEAHSAGTIGATGHGVAEYCGVDPRAWTSGWGREQVVRELRRLHRRLPGADAQPALQRAGGILYSVGISPANAAAALAALRKLPVEPSASRRCADNSRLFVSLAKAKGLDTGPSRDSPVVSGHCQQLVALPEARRSSVQGGHQRAADALSGRPRRSVASALLHHRAAHAAQIRFTVASVRRGCCARPPSLPRLRTATMLQRLTAAGCWRAAISVVVPPRWCCSCSCRRSASAEAPVQERLPDVLQHGEPRAAGVRVAAEDVHQGRQRADHRDAAPRRC